MTATDLVTLAHVLDHDWDGIDPDRAYQILRGLEAALPRLIAEARARRPPPDPAFRCARCGAAGIFLGTFSATNFEWAAEAFRKAHLTCPLAIDGGGI